MWAGNWVLLLKSFSMTWAGLPVAIQYLLLACESAHQKSDGSEVWGKGTRGWGCVPVTQCSSNGITKVDVDRHSFNSYKVHIWLTS